MGEQRFKVGDWVRVKLGQGTALLRENSIYEVLGHSDRKYPIVAVTCQSGGRRELDYDPERFTLYRSASAPEKPATLKVEAGRFYRTRDGRKVGPMIEDKWHDRDYGWTVEHEFKAEYGKTWRADGTFHVDRSKKHNADIIAEWIDEPVAKPSNDNAQPKFKVGDRVRFKQSYSLANWRGVNATVIAVNVWGDDGIKVDANGDVSTESEASLEHITPTTTIVALIENGQPKPSSTPHVHTSEAAAHKEAKRLASKYKGKQFGVFTLTTTHEEAAPVYDHKWQNMAAMGLKIDAIKELRAVAGLDLLSAKRAVEAFAA